MQLCLLCRILNTWGLQPHHFHHVSSRFSVKPARASGTAIIDLQRHMFFQASRRLPRTSTQRLGAGDRRIKKKLRHSGARHRYLPSFDTWGLHDMQPYRQQEGRIGGMTVLSSATRSPPWLGRLIISVTVASVA